MVGLWRWLFGSSTPASAPAFDIAQNMLYQPDPVLQERVPDIDALAGFMKRIEGEGVAYWAEVPRGAGQALTIVVAIKPGGLARFWLESSPTGVGAALLDPFAARLRGLPVPPVRGGPVAFAIHATLWGGQRTGGGWAFMPTEWQERCAGQEVVVPDGVLKTVWPDT
jgi:hypothetical protein